MPTRLISTPRASLKRQCRRELFALPCAPARKNEEEAREEKESLENSFETRPRSCIAHATCCVECLSLFCSSSFAAVLRIAAMVFGMESSRGFRRRSMAPHAAARRAAGVDPYRSRCSFFLFPRFSLYLCSIASSPAVSLACRQLASRLVACSERRRN